MRESSFESCLMTREENLNRFDGTRTLNPDELQNLFAKLDDPYRAIAQLFYLTAGRIGEVLLLEADHITDEHLLFPARSAKLRVNRTAKITEPLAKVLARVKPVSGYLFPTGRGDHITAMAVNDRVKRAAMLLGYEGVNLHSIRQCSFVHLHEQG